MALARLGMPHSLRMDDCAVYLLWRQSERLPEWTG
jgi:hypothetical protein